MKSLKILQLQQTSKSMCLDLSITDVILSSFLPPSLKAHPSHPHSVSSTLPLTYSPSLLLSTLYCLSPLLLPSLLSLLPISLPSIFLVFLPASPPSLFRVFFYLFTQPFFHSFDFYVRRFFVQSFLH